LSEDGLLDGVLPVKQQRGRDTRDRLLTAGQQLVAQRDIDAVSVAEIARAADCSVGAFYQRFHDKESFFRALIAQYVAEGRAATLALFDAYDDDRLIGALVASYAERFRRSTGLVRAGIRKRMEDASVWEPIRRNGHDTADRFIEWLAGQYGRALSRQEEVWVRFAFQILYSTLNNAVVNRPGPLELEDRAFLVQLERVFRLTLFSAGPLPRLHGAVQPERSSAAGK